MEPDPEPLIVAPPPTNETGSELVLVEDGLASATGISSSSTNIAVTYGEPDLACGVAIFGLGLLVLPLLARLNSISLDKSVTDRTGPYSYDVHGEKNTSQPLRVFVEREFRKRFGLADVAFIVQELEMSAKQLEQYVQDCGLDVITKEITKIQRWKNDANRRLKTLRRRIALSYLKLPVTADEAEINKVYKRMALELHPDKGGDPEKFQELQEMRHLLMSSDLGDPDDETVGGKRRKPDEGETQDEDNGDDEDDVAAAKPPKVFEKERVVAHESMLRLLERARQAREELIAAFASSCGNGVGGACDGDDGQREGERCSAVSSNEARSCAEPALNSLRVFTQNFIAVEFGSRRQDGAAELDAPTAMGKIRKFLRRGVEPIAVAAAADLEGTLTILAIHFNCILMSHCESVAIRNVCAALLEAVKEVPRMAKDVLQILERVTVEPLVPQDCPAADPETPARKARAKPKPMGKRRCVKRKRLPKAAGLGAACPPSARMEVATTRAGATLATTAGENGNLGHLVFDPPPMRCGNFQMRIRMMESRRGQEELYASLAEVPGGPEVATLRGTYVLRDRGVGEDFHSICRASAAQHVASGLRPPVDELAACAALHFDAGGSLRPPFSSLCAAKALAGGFLCFGEVWLEERLRGRDLSLDFYEAVLRCLVGPMKRVTLVMSRLVPVDASGVSRIAPLRRHWARIGFRPADGSDVSGNAMQSAPDAAAWWFMEPGRGGWLRRPKQAQSSAPFAARGEKEAARKPNAGAHSRSLPTIGGDSRQPPSPSRGGFRQRRAHVEEFQPAVGAHPTSSGAAAATSSSAGVPPPDKKQKTDTHSRRVPSTKGVTVLPPSLGGDGASRIVCGLTPRIRYALVSAADNGSVALRRDAELFTNGKPGGTYWGSGYVPASIRGRVFKAFVRGMADVAEVVGALLRKRRLPSPEAVQEVLTPYSGKPIADLGLALDRHAISHFFSKGGRAVHVINAVLDEAAAFYEERETPPEGQQALEEKTFARYHALPLHMLDGDFEFVRKVLFGDAGPPP